MKNIKVSTQFKLVILGLIFIFLIGLAKFITSQKDQAAVLEPNLSDEEKIEDRTDSWTTFNDEEVGFSFKYPPELDDECCTMGGPASGDLHLNKVYVDLDTINSDVPDQPFAGISISVITKDEDQSFEQYMADEVEALHLQEKDFYFYMAAQDEPLDEEFVDNGTQSATLIDGQKGLLLNNYSWDEIERYYVPFPNSSHVLVIGKSSVESTKFSFDEISQTIKFTH